MKSSDYHDYVIKNGRFVGEFEEMYKYSDDIPWHQDKTACLIFSELDFLVLKCFSSDRNFSTIAEVGCGLGFFVNRLLSILPDSQITGFDISQTAINSAKERNPDMLFYCRDILQDNFAEFSKQFQLVIAKDFFWYVLDHLDIFLANLSDLSSKYIYFAQSFPDEDQFLGSDIFPNATALERYLCNSFDLVYSLIEKDSEYNYREYAHVLVKIKDV